MGPLKDPDLQLGCPRSKKKSKSHSADRLFAMLNRFGLSRKIPSAIARAVRQRCGFGCVVCGNAIYQYEHLSPTFADAQFHDAEAIVLLCGGCHDRVTRGLLSKQSVEEQARSPKCLQDGFSFGAFDVGPDVPELSCGGFRGKGSESLIEIDGDRILGVYPPEVLGGPFRITAFLKDSNGQPVLFIENNEWQTPSSNWDVEISGPRITIKQKAREISLILRSEARRAIVIEKLKFEHNGNRIEADNDAAVFTTRSGHTFEICGGRVDHCRVGIQIREGSVGIGVGGGSFSARSLYIKTVPKVSNMTIGGSSVTRPLGAQKIPTARPLSKMVERNDPCPCGNGKKYKKCHGF